MSNDRDDGAGVARAADGVERDAARLLKLDRTMFYKSSFYRDEVGFDNAKNAARLHVPPLSRVTEILSRSLVT